jgi:hypothetical protein
MAAAKKGASVNLLILVTIITWSFNGGYQNTASYCIVSSPEDGALLVYKDQHSSRSTEPDQKVYKLYRVDITGGTIKEESLQIVKFEAAANTKESPVSSPNK